MKTKNIISVLFFISFYTIIGQELNDNFDHGNLTNWIENSPGTWSSNLENPINGTNSLKHNLTSEAGAGISYISHNTSGLDLKNQDISWQFNLKNGSWDPSTGNKFWVYLTASEYNLDSENINGYAVGVNFSDTSDLLTLWKITNGNIDSAIITSSIDWNANETKGIKVKRSSTGRWELLVDNDGDFDNLTTAGTPNTNTDYLFINYFGLHFTYTATRAGLLWLDDVLIESNTPSTEPSLAFDAATSSINESNTSFETLIPILFSNYQNTVNINVTVNSNSTADPDDYTLNTNYLTFNNNDSQDLSLTINNDLDYDNETIILDLTTTSGTVTITTSQHTINVIDNDSPVVITEILADPDASNGDANGDGTISSSQDEFIEIYNSSGAPLDITGWTLADATKERHLFPEGSVIPTNQTIVVFGGGLPTEIPGITQIASTGSLVLNNSGDTITLKNELGLEILVETYDSNANNNQSIAREEDITGTFIQHATITSNPILFSPGRQNTTNISFESTTLSTTTEEVKRINIHKSSNNYNEIKITGLQGDAILKIFSLTGNELISKNITSYGTSTIFLPNFNYGIYIALLQYNESEFTKKMILK